MLLFVCETFKRFAFYTKVNTSNLYNCFAALDFGWFELNLIKFLKKCKKIYLTEFLGDGGGGGRRAT